MNIHVSRIECSSVWNIPLSNVNSVVKHSWLGGTEYLKILRNMSSGLDVHVEQVECDNVFDEIISWSHCCHAWACIWCLDAPTPCSHCVHLSICTDTCYATYLMSMDLSVWCSSLAEISSNMKVSMWSENNLRKSMVVAQHSWQAAGRGEGTG